MKTITLYKADPITNHLEVEDVNIIINQKLPEFRNLKEAELFYNAQSEKLRKALAESLPQGMRYILLIKLLEDRIDYYKGI